MKKGRGKEGRPLIHISSYCSAYLVTDVGGRRREAERADGENICPRVRLTETYQWTREPAYRGVVMCHC